MQIVYFGTDVFLAVFSTLLDSEHTITDLYTYHNPEEYIRDEAISALAQKHNIPIHYERITEEEIIALFQTGKCDLLLSAEYDAKIPTPNLANFRGLNIHNSLLPEGRGYFPIEMRLFKGYKYGGVTIHQLAENFDQGDIVLQQKFFIDCLENDRAVYAKCNRLAAEMIKLVLNNFQDYWKKAKAQSGGSYWEKPCVSDYTVTENMTTAEVEHVYRSFGRFTELVYQGKKYKVEHIVTPHSANWVSDPEVLAQRKRMNFKTADGLVIVYWRS